MTVVLALVAALGCLSAPPARDGVVFGHSSGGPAPIISFVTIRPDGEIVLQVSSRPIRGRIDPAEAAAVIEAMRAPNIGAVLATLRARGYQSGCCDQEDIFIEIDGVITETPVRTSDFQIVDGVIVTDEKPLVPGELLEILRWVDRLARAAFGPRHVYPLAPRP